MSFNGQGAGQGAMTGAATGAAVGSVVPVIGTGLGALGGATAGALSGGFLSGDAPWYDQSWFDQRSNEISQFEQALSGARQSYLNSLGGMYQQSFDRFSQNAEPGFATRGLPVNSGAFAAELARKSADYSAQLQPIAYQQQIQDLNTAEGLRAQLFGAQTSAKMGQSNLGWQNNNQNQQALGGFAGNLAMMALTKGMSGGSSSAGHKFDPSMGPYAGNYGGGLDSNYFGAYQDPSAGYGKLNLRQR